MSAPFERGAQHTPKLSLDELNEMLQHWQALREPGPFLTTFIQYLRQGKYSSAAARSMCFSLGEQMLIETVGSSEYKEKSSERKKRRAYGMRELAGALQMLGGKLGSVEDLIRALTDELSKCGIEDQNRVRAMRVKK